jgi:hypothetical protein
MVSSFEIGASERLKIHYLDKDFQLSFQTIKRSYSLSFKENYLRYKYLGKKRGFYLKACNKEVVQTIDHVLHRTIASLNKEALFIPIIPKKKKASIKGKLVINESERPIYHDTRLQPSLGNLHTELDALMNQAELKCKK